MSKVRDYGGIMVNLERWLTVHRYSCHKTTPVDVVDFREAKELTCPQGCGAHWCKQCNRTFDRGGVHSCDGEAELNQLLGQNNWKRCPGMYNLFFGRPIPLLTPL